jgi:hypothetical protein
MFVYLVGKQDFAHSKSSVYNMGFFLPDYKIKVTRFILTPKELSHVVASLKIWKGEKKPELSHSANENSSAIDVDSTGSTVETILPPKDRVK